MLFLRNAKLHFPLFFSSSNSENNLVINGWFIASFGDIRHFGSKCNIEHNKSIAYGSFDNPSSGYFFKTDGKLD